jgi:hypothetical protein
MPCNGVLGTDWFFLRSHVEEEDDGEVDESGVEDSDIKLVMDQAQVGRCMECDTVCACWLCQEDENKFFDRSRGVLTEGFLNLGTGFRLDKGRLLVQLIYSLFMTLILTLVPRHVCFM